MKDKALDLALEKVANALPAYIEGTPAREYLAVIHSALAAPVQEPVGEVIGTNEYAGFGQIKHVKTIQWRGEPAPIGTKLYTTPPAAAPAPVQEPEPACWQGEDSCPNRQACCDAQHCLYTTPPAAQPAVPDALTSADIQEHIEYVAGWNDCRAAMLEILKARGNT
jgi:hypothetical protein